MRKTIFITQTLQKSELNVSSTETDIKITKTFSSAKWVKRIRFLLTESSTTGGSQMFEHW